MQTSDFDYPLPPDLIAQSPLEKREQARLLVVDNEQLLDSTVRSISSFLRPGDLLVTNNTKVVHARLYGQKPTGAKAEFLIERPLEDGTWLMQIGTNKKVRDGEEFIVAEACFKVVGREGPFFIVVIDGVDDAHAFIDKEGQLPLPPYIKRTPDDFDERRYQTVFAKISGAVAAPTAGLHFSQALLDELAEQGVHSAEVTLHVGAGTFRPVKSDDINEHTMHHERVFVPEETVEKIRQAKAQGGRIVAVGTTTVRALESAVQDGTLQPYEGDTNLFITPGYRFKVVELMLTNFHLPRSTLLMMVSAFSGVKRIKKAYQHAINERYRFFSYGDAMLLTRDES